MERVRPPFYSWLLSLFFSLGIGISFGAPFGITVGTLAALATFALVSFALWRSIFDITVNEDTLVAERRSIQLDQVLAALPLDRVMTRRWLGPQADPAAFIAMRGWIHTAVKVDVARDGTTPYWFICTKHPDELAIALNRNRSN